MNFILIPWAGLFLFFAPQTGNRLKKPPEAGLVLL